MGICPHCESLGPVGVLCSQEVCNRRGYRFIPGEYAVGLMEEDVDPLFGKLLDDYLIVELLGVGGFGKVYLSLQLPIIMKTALKLLELEDLSQEMRDTVLEKFEGEARVLAQLTHPNIVRLLKYGFYRGQPFLVMEYVDGGLTLGEEIDERDDYDEWFQPGEIERLMRQVLDALEAAHGIDVIHRDLKPDNLMIQQAPGHPDMIRVLDFGLAKYVGSGSSTKTTMGTPEYVAPEQLTGRNIGPWTDLYALGAIIFQLVARELPFSEESVDQALAQKLDPTYDPLDRLGDVDLPPPMRAFLKKALARRVESRFKSVPEFRKAFGDAMASLDPSFVAPPPGLTSRQDREPSQETTGKKNESEVSVTSLAGEASHREQPKKPGTRSTVLEARTGKSRKRESQAAFKRWMESEKLRLDRERQRLEAKEAHRRVAFSVSSLAALPDDDSRKEGSDDNGEASRRVKDADEERRKK